MPFRCARFSLEVARRRPGAPWRGSDHRSAPIIALFAPRFVIKDREDREPSRSGRWRTPQNISPTAGSRVCSRARELERHGGGRKLPTTGAFANAKRARQGPPLSLRLPLRLPRAASSRIRPSPSGSARDARPIPFQRPEEAVPVRAPPLFRNSPARRSRLLLVRVRVSPPCPGPS